MESEVFRRVVDVAKGIQAGELDKGGVVKKYSFTLSLILF